MPQTMTVRVFGRSEGQLVGINRGDKFGETREDDYAIRLCQAVDKERGGLGMFGDDLVPGAAVQLRVTGAGGGVWHIRRETEGWELGSGGHPKPTAQVTMDADGAWRMFTRNPRTPVPTMEGDERLGRRAMEAVAIIA
jgi:hypothetical protein